MLGGIQSEADQIDHGIWPEIEDLATERSVLFRLDSVQGHPADAVPLGEALIGTAVAAGDGNYLLSLPDQARHEPRTDVARRANHNYSHNVALNLAATSATLAGLRHECVRFQRFLPRRRILRLNQPDRWKIQTTPLPAGGALLLRRKKKTQPSAPLMPCSTRLLPSASSSGLTLLAGRSNSTALRADVSFRRGMLL